MMLSLQELGCFAVLAVVALFDTTASVAKTVVTASVDGFVVEPTRSVFVVASADVCAVSFFVVIGCCVDIVMSFAVVTALCSVVVAADIALLVLCFAAVLATSSVGALALSVLPFGVVTISFAVVGASVMAVVC